MGHLVANLHRSIMAVPEVWYGEGEIFCKVSKVINFALLTQVLGPHMSPGDQFGVQVLHIQPNQVQWPPGDQFGVQVLHIQSNQVQGTHGDQFEVQVLHIQVLYIQVQGLHMPPGDQSGVQALHI